MHVHSTQQARVHFAYMYILPSKLVCILHTHIIWPAGQDVFHIHVYSAQQARMHFTYMYIPPSWLGCILHTCIICPASQNAFCIELYTFLLASQDAFHIHVYSAQQARMHFTLYMYIPPGSLGSILHTCIFCPAS